MRAGEHAVAAPRFALERLGPWDYLTCLHRAGQNWAFQVWSVILWERLPRIAVPFRAGHADVALDLQNVFERAYAEGNYRRRIDYRAEPTPPQSPACADWADQLLRADGARPG